MHSDTVYQPGTVVARTGERVTRPDDRGDDGDVEGREQAAAFAILGSATRLRILRELWESEETPVGFSALRARVGMRDPGQFAYHLNKLVGPYVRKTDEGYDIRTAGVNAVWAVVSGELADHPDTETFAVEGGCVDCDRPLSARYEDELFFVECADCGRVYTMAPFPPSGLVDRTPAEVLTAFDRRSRTLFEQVVNDVCPRCAGHGTVSLVDENATSRSLEPPPVPGEFAVRFRCDVCGFWATDAVDVLLTFHQRVETFFRDCGVDFEEIPIWFRSRYVDADVELRSVRPLSIRVLFAADDATLDVVVDETLAIEDCRTVAADDG